MSYHNPHHANGGYQNPPIGMDQHTNYSMNTNQTQPSQTTGGFRQVYPQNNQKDQRPAEIQQMVNQEANPQKILDQKMGFLQEIEESLEVLPGDAGLLKQKEDITQEIAQLKQKIQNNQNQPNQAATYSSANNFQPLSNQFPPGQINPQSNPPASVKSQLIINNQNPQASQMSQSLNQMIELLKVLQNLPPSQSNNNSIQELQKQIDIQQRALQALQAQAQQPQQPQQPNNMPSQMPANNSLNQFAPPPNSNFNLTKTENNRQQPKEQDFVNVQQIVEKYPIIDQKPRVNLNPRDLVTDVFVKKYGCLPKMQWLDNDRPKGLSPDFVLQEMQQMIAQIKLSVNVRSLNDNNQPNANYYKFLIENRIQVDIKLGKMEDEKAHILVVATDQNLQHQDPYAQQILAKGTKRIELQCQKWQQQFGQLPPNGLAITESGTITQTKFIIHINAPDFRWQQQQDHENDMAQKMKVSMLNVLDSAQFLGARTVAMPALSTGMRQYPPSLCAQVMIKTLTEWTQNCPTGKITTVTIVAGEQATFVEFEKNLSLLANQQQLDPNQADAPQQLYNMPKEIRDSQQLIQQQLTAPQTAPPNYQNMPGQPLNR